MAQSLEEGRRALALGAWEEAGAAFRSALRVRRTPEALEGLGNACWWLNDAECVFAAREEAYRLYTEAGDRLGAARIALSLYWDHRAFRGEAAVSNGWLQRAESLLADDTGSLEFGWLHYRKAQAALYGGHDPATARAHIAVCRSIGRERGSMDLDMGGLALEGLAWVTEGDPAAGRRCLDEAMAAIVGGEVTDITIIGLASCHLISACEKIHDYERASQWCERLKVFSSRWRIVPLFAICRTLYAGLCLSRGTFDDAESALTAAAGELAATHPSAAPEAIARLGELRRRQGRLEEAVALFSQVAMHPIAALGQAAIDLDGDQPLVARERVDRYLRGVPPRDCTGRTAALTLLVRATTALSDNLTAMAACEELDVIAIKLATDPIRAMAASSHGMVSMAGRNWDAARTAFEDALDLFTHAGMPFEAGRARIDRARALEAAGRVDDATAELRQAVRTFQTIGASGDAERAQSSVHRLAEPRRGVNHGPSAVDRLTARERDVLKLVGDGLSNPDIADRLGLSPHTVHRHVSNILTKLDLPSRAAAAAVAARSGAI